MTYPRGEIVWTGYYNRSGDLLFIITSKETREYYFLYEYRDDAFVKLGKAKNPLELTERFHVHEKMCEERVEGSPVS